MDTYSDISEPSAAGVLYVQSMGEPQLAVMGSSIVNRIAHSGRWLEVKASLAGERSVGFNSNYVYQWEVRLTGHEDVRSIEKQQVEVEAALSEQLGAFSDWSPRRETTNPASGSLSVGVPTIGSIGGGFNPGTVELVSSERKDLNRIYWLFRKANLKREDGFRAVVGGSFTAMTFEKPTYSSIDKVAEFFPIRLLIRAGFRSRRTWKRLWLFPEIVVAMPSFVFLLHRKWDPTEAHSDGMSG